MMSSKINVFQRLARQWDQIHPYNAAQVLQLEGRPDPQRLTAAWHDALGGLGLGRVRVDGNSFHYECLNGELSHYGVKFLPAGSSLEEYISHELNRRFDNPAEPPFRPFVVEEQGSYYAGVVYHHWVADSVSIRMVLREWFVRTFDPAKARRTPIRLAPHGYARFFPLLEGTGMGRGLLTATQWASGLRRVRRVDMRNGTDMAVRFALRPLPLGWIHQLHDTARRRGVTLNDLFMAAIARVCEKYVPTKLRRGARRWRWAR